MEFSAVSRARTASAAAAGCSLDYGEAFPPSKRQRLGENDRELATNEAPPASVQDSEESSFMERLLLELTSSASWKLSRERSITQNESFLNEQLAHAVLLSGSDEMTAELSRLPFAVIVNMSGVGSKQQQQRIESHVRHAMDIVSWLLVDRQQSMRRQDALMDRLRMLGKDVERKDVQLQQLQTDVEALKMQLAQQENMFHGREQALVAERKALQQDKRHLEVTCAKLQGQETAFKTQLRRKDVEYERLKKSLQDAVQRSAKEQRNMSMGRVLNGLSERRQTAQRVVQSHETLMNKRLLDNLERKRDELLFENETLAKHFASLQKGVESLSAQYKKAVALFLAQRGDDIHTHETMELARVPLDDFTPTPLQLGVRANVPAYIATTVEKLAGKVRLFERAMQAELEYATTHPSQDVVDALKKKLAEAHDVIAEQDRLLQASLLTPCASPETRKSTTSTNYEKENVHVNTQRRESPTPLRAAGRRRPVEHELLEQWEDSLHTEFHALRHKNQHLTEERTLLQAQGEALDLDRLAFEMRNFEHFFGDGVTRVVIDDDELVMQDVDCPTTPRTAAYLRTLGIVPSVVE